MTKVHESSFLPHLGKGDVLQLGLGLPHPVGRRLQTRCLGRPLFLRSHVSDPPPETLVVSPVSHGELVVLGTERGLLAEGIIKKRRAAYSLTIFHRLHDLAWGIAHAT